MILTIIIITDIMSASVLQVGMDTLSAIVSNLCEKRVTFVNFFLELWCYSHSFSIDSSSPFAIDWHWEVVEGDRNIAEILPQRRLHSNFFSTVCFLDREAFNKINFISKEISITIHSCFCIGGVFRSDNIKSV